MKKRYFLLFALLLAAATLAARPAHAQDNSAFDAGQILVGGDVLNLISDDVLLLAGEYYVTNDISAGLEIFSTSEEAAGITVNSAGYGLFGRYHFLPGSKLFKGSGALGKGNFFGLGGYGTVNASAGGVSASESSLYLGAGYLVPFGGSWAADLVMVFALNNDGWDEGLQLWIKYAL